LLAGVLLCLAMEAQPITVQQTIPEITLVAYGSPGFDEALAKLGVSATLGGAANQYLIAIRVNAVTQPITGIRLLYTITDGSVGPRQPVNQLRVLQPVNLQSGDAYLTAPTPWMHVAEALGKQSRNMPPMPPVDRLAGKTISVNVDSLTYADGTVKGPDTVDFTTRLNDREQQRTAFLNDLIARLNSPAADADVKAWLQTKAAPPTNTQIPGKSGVYGTNFAAGALFTMANQALDMLGGPGRPTLLAWATALAQQQNKAPALHKEEQ